MTDGSGQCRICPRFPTCQVCQVHPSSSWRHETGEWRPAQTAGWASRRAGLLAGRVRPGTLGWEPFVPGNIFWVRVPTRYKPMQVVVGLPCFSSGGHRHCGRLSSRFLESSTAKTYGASSKYDTGGKECAGVWSPSRRLTRRSGPLALHHPSHPAPPSTPSSALSFCSAAKPRRERPSGVYVEGGPTGGLIKVGCRGCLPSSPGISHSTLPGEQACQDRP